MSRFFVRVSVKLYHIFPEPKRQHAGLKLSISAIFYSYGMAELAEKFLVLLLCVRITNIQTIVSLLSPQQIPLFPRRMDSEEIPLLIIDDKILYRQPVGKMGH